MGFNFPNSPTEGTLFSPSGGPQYIFSNGVWRDKGSFGRSRAFVGDLPPTDPPPVQGDLWWESDTGNLYCYYTDADSSQWVQINTPQAVAQASPFKRTLFQTSTTTFQFDGSTLTADIEVVGAGGGGGGTGAAGAAGTACAGGGGGGGGYGKKLIVINDAIRAATKTITIGTGGVGGAGGAGNNGVDTSYADGTYTVTGIGGNGGTPGIANASWVTTAGGLGGGATGFDMAVTASPGAYGLQVGSSVLGSTSAAATTGAGGTSGIGGGGGGVSRMNASASAATTVGIAGRGFGGGGSGAAGCNAFGAAAAGGTGQIGCVIITEYR